MTKGAEKANTVLSEMSACHIVAAAATMQLINTQPFVFQLMWKLKFKSSGFKVLTQLYSCFEVEKVVPPSLTKHDRTYWEVPICIKAFQLVQPSHKLCEYTSVSYCRQLRFVLPYLKAEGRSVITLFHVYQIAGSYARYHEG